MIKRGLTILLIGFGTQIQAQGWQPVGARFQSLSNATVALSDVWSYHHNPAGLTELKCASLGFSYENRFLLKELQTQAFVFAQPFKWGVLSLGAQSFGYKYYRTTRIGMGYSLRLSEKFSAGVQLNYQGIRIENYGSKGTMTAEAGFLAKIAENITLGFSVSNLGRAQLTDFQDERFSTFLRLGMQYQISQKVRTLLEVEKEVKSKIRVKGGLEYELLNRFFMRAGAASQPIEFSFGFGYQFKNRLKMDLGSAWHQQLGWSPHVGMTFDFKSKENE